MAKAAPIVRVVTATEAQNKFGEIIKRAYASDEHLIVERDGIPVVAIISITTYQQSVGAPPTAAPEMIRRVASASERAEASRNLTALLDRRRAESADIDEEDTERLINTEVTKMRAELAKKTFAPHSRAGVRAPERKARSIHRRPSRRLKV